MYIKDQAQCSQSVSQIEGRDTKVEAHLQEGLALLNPNARVVRSRFNSLCYRSGIIQKGKKMSGNVPDDLLPGVLA